VPDVKFGIKADGTSAKSAIQSVKNEVKSLSGTAKELGGSLKGGIAAFFGVATVGALVHSMASFADEIQNASDRLGVASDRVQEFRIAAKRAGYDLGTFDKIFNNMEKSFSSALGGGKELDVLKKFGLSKDDVQHLNKADALKKILEGSQGMNDSASRAGLTKIFGAKSSNALMAMRDDIISGSPDRIISADAIAQMDEFMDAIEDTKDAILQGLLPAFVALIQWIGEKTAGLREDTANGNKLEKEAAALYFNKHGKESDKDTVFAGMNYQSDIIGANLFSSGEDRKKAVQEAQKKYITKVFGADIFDDVMTDFQPTPSLVDNLTATRQKRQKERAARQALLAGPANRENGDNNKFTQFSKQNLGSSELVRIGGVLGVDIQQRIFHLTIVSNQYLKRIADATEKLMDNANNGISGETEDWAG
jgi:hypothetical protein